MDNNMEASKFLAAFYDRKQVSSPLLTSDLGCWAEGSSVCTIVSICWVL